MTPDGGEGRLDYPGRVTENAPHSDAPAPLSDVMPTVLVLDFGAQYAQLIARRVREANVYSEVVPASTPAAQILERRPAALILSGGPSSVYEPGAPTLDPALLEAGVPVLGLCYGFQSIAHALGGTVAKTGTREYGSTRLDSVDADSVLFAGQDLEQVVWMSHGDAVTQAPEGFAVTASTAGAPVAAFEDAERRIYGVQWHPEVGHSSHGQKVLEQFLHEGAGLGSDWTASNVIEEQVERIRDQIGDKRAICGLSGGVDSAVAAALVQRAIGDRLTCVYVDHGLMRQGESAEIERAFGEAHGGARLVMVDAREDFLSALAGVTDPEAKRKIIGERFIRTFEKAQADIVLESEHDPEATEVRFLVQGTLYPDVVESGGGDGAANIKSHHNVGGLPDDIEFELCEPLRELFKDEVRAVGASSACPRASCTASRSRARVWASASSARSPRSAWTCCAARTRSCAPSSPRPDWTARSGSARWSCSRTCAPWACRVTAAPTATRSSCAPSPARTP